MRKKRNLWESLFVGGGNEPVFVSSIRPCRPLTPSELHDLQIGWLYHSPDPSKCPSISNSCPNSRPGTGMRGPVGFREQWSGRRPHSTPHNARTSRSYGSRMNSGGLQPHHPSIQKPVKRLHFYDELHGNDVVPVELLSLKRHSLSYSDDGGGDFRHIHTPRITISR